MSDKYNAVNKIDEKRRVIGDRREEDDRPVKRRRNENDGYMNAIETKSAEAKPAAVKIEEDRSNAKKNGSLVDGLEALKHRLEGLIRETPQNESRIVETLESMEETSITPELLVSSKASKTVLSLRKHTNTTVAAVSRRLLAKWKQVFQDSMAPPSPPVKTAIMKDSKVAPNKRKPQHDEVKKSPSSPPPSPSTTTTSVNNNGESTPVTPIDSRLIQNTGDRLRDGYRLKLADTLKKASRSVELGMCEILNNVQRAYKLLLIKHIQN